jgi:hypothetical protein
MKRGREFAAEAFSEARFRTRQRHQDAPDCEPESIQPGGLIEAAVLLDGPIDVLHHPRTLNAESAHAVGELYLARPLLDVGM